MWKKEHSEKGKNKRVTKECDEAIRVKCQCLSKKRSKPMGKDAFVVITAIHLATLLSSDSVSECAGEKTVRREKSQSSAAA